MAKFEPTIEESARESSLKTSQPETSDVGVRSSEIRSTENEDKESGKTMNREDALRKLREIIGKDQRYDMDGSEVNQIRNIIEECSSKDSLILLRAAETTKILRDGSYEEMAVDFSQSALKLLEEIQSKTKNYLIRSWIDFVSLTSSNFFPIKEKRKYLERDWEYVSTIVVSGHPDLYEKYYGSNVSVVQNIPSGDVEKLFLAFQRDSFSDVEHEAMWKIYQRFHDPEVAARYDISAEIGEDIPDFERRRVTFTGKNWIDEIPFEKGGMIGPISDRYGIVYSTGFHTEFFFERDPNIEKSETSKEKKRVEKLTVEDVLRKEGLSETGANAEQRLRDQAYLYSILVQPAFRKRIEDDFGIELKDFSVRVQVQFLNFLFEKNEEEVGRVKKFLQSEMYFGNSPFGSKSERADLVRQWRREGDLDLRRKERTDRLKSFLSLEQGGADMGEKILAIGEKLPKEAADTVFAKYAEMADRAGEARKNSEKNADAIEAKLLERGKSFLSWIAEHTKEFAHDERLLSALNERLENLNAETVLAVNALRAMKESGNVEGIKEFLDGSFRILKGNDISSKMKTEMESLYRMSYPSDREEGFRETLVRNLYEQKISDPNARFYTFFVGENGKKSLKAFCSFQDKPDGSVYFGAFNVDEFFSGEKMGCLMMDESLEREAKERVVRGDCIPEKPISEHYLEKRGFIGKSFSTLEGIDLLAIERDDKNAERYETKKLSPEDIIQKSEAHFREASRIFLSVPEQSFSRKSIEATLKEGFVLTRLFRRGEKETAKVYIAFER